LHIVRAKPADAAALTEIAFAAKRHWGYPEEWMEAWRDTLTIRPEFIASHEIHAAQLEGRIIGFYALGQPAGQIQLLHLWVLPAAMGRGIGRVLFTHACTVVKELGRREFEIESDPNAEGFYRHMGAQRVGTNRLILDGQSRELPVLIYKL